MSMIELINYGKFNNYYGKATYPINSNSVTPALSIQRRYSSSKSLIAFFFSSESFIQLALNIGWETAAIILKLSFLINRNL